MPNARAIEEIQKLILKSVFVIKYFDVVIITMKEAKIKAR